MSCFSRYSLTIPRWLFTLTKQHSEAGNHTTHRDVTPLGFHENHSWVSETPKKGRAAYARRKAIMEPVFGQIHTRQGKFVLLRGLEQAGHERDLIAACHNLMKLHTVHTKALLATQAALTARPAT
ncbi:transposase [Cryobacterium sp. TMT2-15-1]|uniref:transposase n=1 Tax=Cryobacterium sp. TMT2-15-1 TaxID=1259246 RepID=UPI0021063CFA|nr:transposase [Cryobacterium sp. TMT2-15-1]